MDIQKLGDMRIRDPFILPDPVTGTYYLCAALRPAEGHPHPGVGVYTSQDLEDWQGPHTVFEIPEDFWAQEGIWALEPLFAGDGGHGMLFRRFDGTLMLSLHQPNRSPEERARLFEVEDMGERIRLVGT